VEAAQAAVRWDPDWRRRFVHLAMRRDRRIAKVRSQRRLLHLSPVTKQKLVHVCRALDELFSIRQLVVVCQFGIITNLSTATFRPAVRCSASGKSITVIASNFLIVPGFGKGKISVSSTGDVLPGG
jgi:hypothetical protein